jgi:hypothetical protein
MPGDGLTHGPPATKKQAAVTTGQARSTGIPCAMALTASFVLFPVTMLGCHRHPQGTRCALWEFSACIGAPEPHDFAVRHSIIRLRKDCA